MAKFNMKILLRKMPKNPNLFEFTISTPTLRSQFILPRQEVNRLRILIERAITNKSSGQ